MRRRLWLLAALLSLAAPAQAQNTGFSAFIAATPVLPSSPSVTDLFPVVRGSQTYHVSGTFLSGNIIGPASSTLNELAVWADTTGTSLKDGSGVAVSHTGTFNLTDDLLNAGVVPTGTGGYVRAINPALVTPNLGTPSAAVLTNATGLPISTGVSGLAAGVATFLGTPSSANLRAALTDETGIGLAYFQGGDLGTPSAGVLTNATGLPIGTGLTGAGTGVLTALAVNVGSAGSFIVNGGALGTPSSGTLTNATGLPVATGISGLGTGVATALAVNVGSAGAFVTFDGALGTPSSGILTNATGLPISTGVSGLGAGVATFLATPSSANLLAALTTKTGTGSAVFNTGPTFTGAVVFDGGTSIATSTGFVKVGYGTTLSLGGSSTPHAFQSATAGPTARLALARYVSGAAFPVQILLGRSRGASLGAAGALVSGDQLAKIEFDGDDGSAADTLAGIAARITVDVGGTVSTGVVPGRIGFSVANLAGTLVEQLALLPGGDNRQGTGSALATTATDGFFLVSTTAGTPTGVPTNAGAGQIPVVYDKTNKKICAYNGGWSCSAAFTP